MHGPDRKPSRGVCQVCGRPVVAYQYEAGGCIRPGPILVSGHEFDKNGRLIDVRCPEHWNGIRPNSYELNRAPTAEDLELASKIRGAPVTYEEPPPRDPNVFTFPVIKQVFPTLSAADIVGVQPMTVPVGPGMFFPFSIESKKLEDT